MRSGNFNDTHADVRCHQLNDEIHEILSQLGDKFDQLVSEWHDQDKEEQARTLWLLWTMSSELAVIDGVTGRHVVNAKHQKVEASA